jgi:hypothetical protein
MWCTLSMSECNKVRETFQYVFKIVYQLCSNQCLYVHKCHKWINCLTLAFVSEHVFRQVHNIVWLSVIWTKCCLHMFPSWFNSVGVSTSWVDETEGVVYGHVFEYFLRETSLTPSSHWWQLCLAVSIPWLQPQMFPPSYREMQQGMSFHSLVLHLRKPTVLSLSVLYFRLPNLLSSISTIFFSPPIFSEFVRIPKWPPCKN